jgi:hypothetical protein
VRLTAWPAARATRPSKLHNTNQSFGPTPSSIPSSAHLSMSSLAPGSLYRRTVDYFNNYPFVKYSLLLCGVVLGGSLVFESYSKHKKKLLPQILSLPPRVGHRTLPRPAELGRLREVWRDTRRRGEGVVYVVGPPGSGKTELVCQYGQQFIQQTGNFMYRFRICKPAVLCLDGSSGTQLQLSLQEAAMCLGIREEDTQPVGGEEGRDLLVLAKTVETKLRANGVPWLIIVDNLTQETRPVFESVFHSRDLVNWDWRVGHVVVTCRQPPPEVGGAVLPISESLEKDEGLALLQSLSPSTSFSSADSSKLSHLLASSPLTLSLAASTVNIYSASMEQEGSPRSTPALEEYLDILAEQVSTSSNRFPPSPNPMTETCLKLYVEAAATDPRALHTFDLLGSLSPAHPVPASLLDHHLSSSSSSSFYRLPPLTPPVLPTLPQPQDTSFWAQLKMLLPFGHKAPPPSSPLASFDRLHHLRNSPILSFKKYSSEGFELVQLHPLAKEELSPRQLLSRTVPRLERAHLEEAREVFRNTAWFRNYRTFDETGALVQYRRTMPGVGGAGVMTREEFQSSPMATDLQYSDYLHTISHNHRVSSSIISQLKILDDGFASLQFCRYVEPHLSHLLSQPSLSDSDRVMCRYGLASVASASSSHQARTLYQSVLEDQRRVLGVNHPAVARTLTDMAGLVFAGEDVEGAQDLLETSLKIYSSMQLKSLSSEVKIDQGLALASLAVVVSCRGEKRRSRDLLEEALSLYQTMPESGEVTVYQRRLVASTLTDLSQAYLGLGQTVLAQKYVELAMLAMPNVYPEGNSETVRALTVAGAVYALLGDKRESQRVGQEAGKEKARLEKRHLVFM